MLTTLSVSSARCKSNGRRLKKRLPVFGIMKKKILKSAAIIFGVLAALALLTAVLASILNILKSDDGVANISTEDIFLDAAYLKLPRDVIYDEYGDSEPLTKENIDEMGDSARFFFDYFNCVINGKCDMYPDFFTQAYIDSHVMPKFTMQKLYDISVTLYSRSTDGERTDAFTVSFKIKDNNSTFCKTDSNMSKTFIYKIVYTDGKPRIKEILDRKVAYDR